MLRESGDCAALETGGPTSFSMIRCPANRLAFRAARHVRRRMNGRALQNAKDTSIFDWRIVVVTVGLRGRAESPSPVAGQSGVAMELIIPFVNESDCAELLVEHLAQMVVAGGDVHHLVHIGEIEN